MRGYTMVIGVDKTLQVTTHEHFPSLKFLQSAVGGYIETVPYFDKMNVGGGERPVLVYCNENGRALNLPYNEMATLLWHDCLGQDIEERLLGRVVVVYGDQEFMRRA